MPRRSKIERDFGVVPLPQYQRPEPPPDLEPAVAAVWRQTVLSMRPDWFPSATWPLLIAYCRSVAAGQMLAARLRDLTIDDPAYGRFLDLCNKQDRQTAALARSLRITPKSRRDPVDSRWQDRRRPWEG
jgi:hypothetical protein